MTVVKSKFRNLFIAKIITFTILAILAVVLCFFYSVDATGAIYYRSLFVTGIAVVVLSLIGLLRVLKISRVQITSTEIINCEIITRKKTAIALMDVETISSSKVQAQGPLGYINDGYFSNVVISKSGKIIEISPDEFKNADELMRTIFERTQNEI